MLCTFVCVRWIPNLIVVASIHLNSSTGLNTSLNTYIPHMCVFCTVSLYLIHKSHQKEFTARSIIQPAVSIVRHVWSANATQPLSPLCPDRPMCQLRLYLTTKSHPTTPTYRYHSSFFMIGCCFFCSPVLCVCVTAFLTVVQWYPCKS